MSGAGVVVARPAGVGVGVAAVRVGAVAGALAGGSWDEVQTSQGIDNL